VDYWLVNGSQKSAGSVTHTENNITGSLDVSVVFKKQAAMPWLNLLLE
jgi:ABC-type taurine transport system ATPase subunit